MNHGCIADNTNSAGLFYDMIWSIINMLSSLTQWIVDTHTLVALVYSYIYKRVESWGEHDPYDMYFMIYD